MQFIRCLNSDCEHCQAERCTLGLVSLNEHGMCTSEKVKP